MLFNLIKCLCSSQCLGRAIRPWHRWYIVYIVFFRQFCACSVTSEFAIYISNMLVFQFFLAIAIFELWLCFQWKTRFLVELQLFLWYANDNRCDFGGQLLSCFYLPSLAGGSYPPILLLLWCYVWTGSSTLVHEMARFIIGGRMTAFSWDWFVFGTFSWAKKLGFLVYAAI